MEKLGELFKRGKVRSAREKWLFMFQFYKEANLEFGEMSLAKIIESLKKKGIDPEPLVRTIEIQIAARQVMNAQIAARQVQDTGQLMKGEWNQPREE